MKKRATSKSKATVKSNSTKKSNAMNIRTLIQCERGEFGMSAIIGIAIGLIRSEERRVG